MIWNHWKRACLRHPHSCRAENAVGVSGPQGMLMLMMIRGLLAPSRGPRREHYPERQIDYPNGCLIYSSLACSPRGIGFFGSGCRCFLLLRHRQTIMLYQWRRGASPMGSSHKAILPAQGCMLTMTTRQGEEHVDSLRRSQCSSVASSVGLPRALMTHDSIRIEIFNEDLGLRTKC